MRKIETIGTVTAEGILTLPVPADVPAGPHTVIVEIDERLATPDHPDATDWPTFVQETAGAWRGEFERPPQGDYEVREAFP